MILKWNQFKESVDFKELDQKGFVNLETNISNEVAKSILISRDEESQLRAFLITNGFIDEKSIDSNSPVKKGTPRGFTINLRHVDIGKSCIDLQFLGANNYITIKKQEDEYYIIQYHDKIKGMRDYDNWFKCDQLDGLFKCITFLTPTIIKNGEREIYHLYKKYSKYLPELGPPPANLDEYEDEEEDDQRFEAVELRELDSTGYKEIPDDDMGDEFELVCDLDDKDYKLIGKYFTDKGFIEGDINKPGTNAKVFKLNRRGSELMKDSASIYFLGQENFLNIYKQDDDYFIVGYSSKQGLIRWFKCDQLDGVFTFIDSIMHYIHDRIKSHFPKKAWKNLKPFNEANEESLFKEISNVEFSEQTTETVTVGKFHNTGFRAGISHIGKEDLDIIKSAFDDYDIKFKYENNNIYFYDGKYDWVIIIKKDSDEYYYVAMKHLFTFNQSYQPSHWYKCDGREGLKQCMLSLRWGWRAFSELNESKIKPFNEAEYIPRKPDMKELDEKGFTEWHDESNDIPIKHNEVIAIRNYLISKGFTEEFSPSKPNHFEIDIRHHDGADGVSNAPTTTDIESVNFFFLSDENYFTVCKQNDEYFLLSIPSELRIHDVFYICDELQGLYKCIDHLLPEINRKSNEYYNKHKRKRVTPRISNESINYKELDQKMFIDLDISNNNDPKLRAEQAKYVTLPIEEYDMIIDYISKKGFDQKDQVNMYISPGNDFRVSLERDEDAEDQGIIIDYMYLVFQGGDNIDIGKQDDDYYLLFFNYTDRTKYTIHYKCDGWEGLTKCLDIVLESHRSRVSKASR